MTDDIREYILGLKNAYNLSGLRVLANDSNEYFALHFPDDEGHQANNFYVPIQKEPPQAIAENPDIRTGIQDIKDICKEDGVFIEMAVIIDPENSAAIESISRELQASSIKIVNSRDISDQQKSASFISGDVMPSLRGYSPIPQRALSLIGEPQSILANKPRYGYEEGAILLCLNVSEATAQEYAAYDDFAQLLAMNSGKRVYIIMTNGQMSQ